MSEMFINPKLLRAFIAVAELQNFRAAAERLNRSQSALSMQIRNLEEQLGIVLFHRSTRKVQLSDAGEILLGHVKRAMHELDVGLYRIKQDGSRYRYRVRLACIPSVAGTRLPQVIRRFQEDNPSVQIEVFELLTKRVPDAVINKTVDIGIGTVPENIPPQLHVERLFVEPSCAVFPPGSASFPEQGVSLRALQGLSILTTGPDTIQRDMLEKALHDSNAKINITHQVAHAQTLLSMVDAGLGVAVVPQIAMEILGYGHLRPYPIIDPAIIREVAILTLSGVELPIATSHLKHALLEMLTRSA
ncbi:MAG: LysR family transcriptional regulator [Castellaniella sp.]